MLFELVTIPFEILQEILVPSESLSLSLIVSFKLREVEEFLKILLFAINKISSKAFLLNSFRTFIEGKNKLSSNITSISLNVKIVSFVLLSCDITLSLSKGCDLASTGKVSEDNETLILSKIGLVFERVLTLSKTGEFFFNVIQAVKSTFLCSS